MASPQKENGYTKIANEILEQLMRINISAYESRILWAIIRKTYGYNKKQDWIAFSQLQLMTKLDRRNISKIKHKLLQRKLIIQDSNYIRFNKDYEQWCSINQSAGIEYRDIRPLLRWKGVNFQYSDEILCEWCLKKIRYHHTEVHAHHIIPKCYGGKDISANKVDLCIKCHYSIHEEFEKSIQKDDNIDIDTLNNYYRLFMHRLSSKSTTQLSSKSTNTKEKKENIQKKGKLLKKLREELIRKKIIK